MSKAKHTKIPGLPESLQALSDHERKVFAIFRDGYIRDIPPRQHDLNGYKQVSTICGARKLASKGVVVKDKDTKRWFLTELGCRMAVDWQDSMASKKKA